VSREITKLHEETIRGKATEVLAYYTVKPPKGEIVLVVGGKK
jgi:16S rRNA (cytidine1402-2'-O)-methyltransferase